MNTLLHAPAQPARPAGAGEAGLARAVRLLRLRPRRPRRRASARSRARRAGAARRAQRAPAAREAAQPAQSLEHGRAGRGRARGSGAWSSPAAAPPAGSSRRRWLKALGPLLDITPGRIGRDRHRRGRRSPPSRPRAPSTICSASTSASSCARPRRASSSASCSRTGRAIGDRYIHSFGQLGRSTWLGDFHHFWLRGARRRASPARSATIASSSRPPRRAVRRLGRPDQLRLSSRRLGLCPLPAPLRRAARRPPDRGQDRRGPPASGDRLHHRPCRSSAASGSKAICSSTAPAFAAC